MSTTITRLREAERALQLLEIQIEQYRFHLEELVGQPYEAEKARAMLARMTMEQEWQQRYCDLLGNAVPSERLSARNGSSRVA
jgi:hypothetical protein